MANGMFAPFDYSQAMAAGTQNALGQLQFAQAANKLAQQNQALQQQGMLRGLKSQALQAGTPFNNPSLAKYAQFDAEGANELQSFLENSTEAQRESFAKANEMIGNIAMQIDPNDPRAPMLWDMGIDQLATQGIDLSQFKGRYSTDNRELAIAMAGLTKDAINQYGTLTKGVTPEGKLEYRRPNKRTGELEPVKDFYPIPGREGIEITSPSGETIRIGGPSQGLSKPTQTKVEQNIIDTGAMISQVNSIRNRFKPEYQELGTRWDAMLTNFKSKLGFEPDAEEQLFLNDFAAYKSDAFQLFTRVLNELSGAAVTASEAERAKQWLPNAGTGLLDGDSPTVMKSKLNRLYDFNQKAMMKYAYIQKHGLSLGAVDVDQMPGLMQKRGEEIAAELREKNIQGEELKQAVKNALANEFGLLAQ